MRSVFDVDRRGLCGAGVWWGRPTRRVANRRRHSTADRGHVAASPGYATAESWAPRREPGRARRWRSEEHTSELQSRGHLVCRLLLEKKKKEVHNTNACTHDE